MSNLILQSTFQILVMNFNKSVDNALDVLLLPGRMQEQVDGAGAQTLGNGADNAFVIDALGVIQQKGNFAVPKPLSSL